MIGSLEEQRQHELHALCILDTEPEAQFDELVELAAAICGTPVSTFTLIDTDRQWVKATKGDFPKEIPREAAFCNYMVESDAELLVEDATQDDRFRDKTLVTGVPGVRFYAGVPVRSASGLPLGGLCVVDTQPRKISPQQQSALAVLARQVGARLELLRQRRAAEAAVAELQRYQIELEEANARLRQMSLSDALTGLANRRAFEDRLASEFRSAKAGALPLALLMIDVDDFKRVNDLFGHGYGDVVLQRVAMAIARSTRMLDLAVRYGGEEFAVLMPAATTAGAVAVAQRIRRELQLEDWDSWPVTVSVGIGVYRSQMGDSAALTSSADLALYEAKSSGKDRFALDDFALNQCGDPTSGGAACRAAAATPSQPLA